MADKDKNYTKIANEILESMAKTKLSPRSINFICSMGNTYGYQRKNIECLYRILLLPRMRQEIHTT